MTEKRCILWCVHCQVQRDHWLIKERPAKFHGTDKTRAWEQIWACDQCLETRRYGLTKEPLYLRENLCEAS